MSKPEVREVLKARLETITPEMGRDKQSERGRLFEILADLTDEDGAMAEMEDYESLGAWFNDLDSDNPPEEPPQDDFSMDTEGSESLGGWFIENELDNCIPSKEPQPVGDHLLDKVSREKLPPLYSGEEKGLEALAQVKFFTPDSNWTWYASEFAGEDIFFGLVSGFEVELGYFSLKELQEFHGPLGLQIERDLFFEPQTLGRLMEINRNEKED
jgi:hypothetical protein